VKHHQFLLDVEREPSPAASAINQEVGQEFTCRVGIAPLLGQGIRNARDRVCKLRWSRLGGQIQNPVHRPAQNRMVSGLCGSPPALPTGGTKLTRHLQTRGRFIECAAGGGEVSCLERQGIVWSLCHGSLRRSPISSLRSPPFKALGCPFHMTMLRCGAAPHRAHLRPP